MTFEEDFQEQDPRHGGREFDWRGMLYALLDRWWIIALCIAVAAGLAAIHLSRTKPIYAATAVIKFESDTPRIFSTADMIGESANSDEQRKEKLKEIRIVLQSPPLLSRVIERNHLAGDSRFLSSTPTNSTNNARLVSALARSIQVAPRAGTSFMDVTVEHPNPELSATLANSLVEELIHMNFESYRAASQSASSFLADEARNLQRKLADSETNLKASKDQSLTLEQRQTIVADNLKQLNQKLNEAKAERIRMESEYASVSASGTNILALLVLPRVAGDPAVSAIRSGIAQQEVEFANVRQIFLPKHPAYIQAEGRLAELQNALANAALKAAQTMRVAYDNSAEHERALAAEVEKQEKLAQLLNQQSVPHNIMMRDMDQYRTLYDSVVKRMGETTIAGNLDKRSIQIFQPATVPRNPVKPQKLLILAMSLALGLGLGMLLVFVLELFDDSLRTLNETEDVLKLRVLSTVPRLEGEHGNGQQIVMENDNEFSGAESFRALRTSLFLLDPDGKHRSFLMTSTLPGEGKTFCTVNFAVSLARQGLRTLVVDCDLRRPMLEEVIWGERRNVPGLADYLSGDGLTVHETRIENLYFIPAGAATANASELLGRAGLKNLLEEALRKFDRVVIDSAPIFGVSDTLRLVKEVDAVCLVVQAGKTPRRLASRCLQLLTRAGAPVAGIVLNAVRDTARTAYDNPYYDYGYHDSPRRKSSRLTRRALPASVNVAKPDSQPNHPAAGS